MYMNEQCVILIHLNARVFTVKPVNSFDIFFLCHFRIFKIKTRVFGHYLFIILEILVVKSIFSLKSHSFIQYLNAKYLNSLFLQPDCQILCYREHRFRYIYVIVEPGCMCREHGSFDYFLCLLYIIFKNHRAHKMWQSIRMLKTECLINSTCFILWWNIED